MRDRAGGGAELLAGYGGQNQLGQAMGAKGLQTRRRLLDAVERLLRSVPLRELCVAEISKEAGTSNSTFYVYFNDVPAAVLALAGEFSQSPPNLLGLMASRWDAPSAVAQAYAFVSCYLDQCEAHAHVFRVRNLASDEGDRRFTEQRINAVRPLINLMVERIGERRAAGDLPADLEPASAAGALLAFIERIAVPRLATRTEGVTRARLVDVAAFLAVLLFSSGHVSSQLFELRSDGRSKPRGAPAPEHRAGPMPVLRNQHGQSLRARGERTRRVILDAVAALLETHSLMDLSVADIVRAANTSNATFYRYFQDVPEAVLAIISGMDQNTPELVQLLQADWDERGQRGSAEAFVRAYIEHWQANRALFRVRNLAADEGDDRFSLARVEANRQLIDLLTDRIEAAQARGALPKGLHARSAADGVLAMIERLAVTPILGGDVTPTTLTRAAAYFLSIVVGGLEPRGAAPA